MKYKNTRESASREGERPVQTMDFIGHHEFFIKNTGKTINCSPNLILGYKINFHSTKERTSPHRTLRRLEFEQIFYEFECTYVKLYLPGLKFL